MYNLFFLFLQLNKPATNKTPFDLGSELDTYAQPIGDPFEVSTVYNI